MANKRTSSLRNITLSAEQDLIEMARAKARASKTTLNHEFRNWLRQFTNTKKDSIWYFDFMKQFEGVNSGRKFKREEFYEE